MLGGISSIENFITFNEQSQSNRDCSFHCSIAFIFREIISRESFFILYADLCSFYSIPQLVDFYMRFRPYNNFHSQVVGE